jgi:hypothetical protein
MGLLQRPRRPGLGITGKQGIWDALAADIAREVFSSE